MLYLSAMLDRKIVDEREVMVGRLVDIVAEPDKKFPLVKGIVVKMLPRHGKESVYVPWKHVHEMKNERLMIRCVECGVEPEKSDMFLYRDLLDKQIVDMDGYRIVRVSDILIARSGGELRVIGVDVGVLAIMRRLGLRPLAEFLKSKQGSVLRDRIVPWNLVSPTGPMPSDVKLSVPYREFLEIHPSDLADIVEQLPEEQRALALALVGDPKAADVLIRMLPGIRSEVAGAMEDERLSDLLEIMPPDKAADILGSLSREKAEALLSLMGIKEASVVSELLGYEPSTAGGRMTTRFVAVPDNMNSEAAIAHLRKEGREAETIYYVYVVDRSGHLSGVLSLRDLLRAPPDVMAGDIMMRDVITVDIYDDQESVAGKLARYNLLAVPVVDDDHVLKGIVTVDDAIDVIKEEFSEDFAQLSGVPFEKEGTPVRDTLDARRWGVTMLTFLGGILATVLFNLFRSGFEASLALIYFVPLVLRMAHDVSVWSMAAAVHDIRVETVIPSKVGKLLAREYAYTLAAAVLVSVLGFSVGMLWVKTRTPAIAGAVGLFVAVATTGMLGFAAPLLLLRARPGQSAVPGRLVGVLVMAASVLSFLAVSGFLVRAWQA